MEGVPAGLEDELEGGPDLLALEADEHLSSILYIYICIYIYMYMISLSLSIYIYTYICMCIYIYI